MRVFRKPALLAGLASVVLSACGAPPPGTALTVNDTVVPSHLYDVLVRSGERRLERQGLLIGSGTSEGAARLKDVEVSAIKKLVRDATLDELAKQRHIVVTAAELDAGVGRIEKGVGGTTVVDGQLALDQMTRQDFKDLLRFTMLEQRLSLADPKGFPRALSTALRDAHVTVYVAPCSSDHSYPQCLNGS